MYKWGREGPFILLSSAEKPRDQISWSKFPSRHHMLPLLYLGSRSSVVPCMRSLWRKEAAQLQLVLTAGSQLGCQPPNCSYYTAPFTRKGLQQSQIFYKWWKKEGEKSWHGQNVKKPQQLEKQCTTTTVKTPLWNEICKLKFNFTPLRGFLYAAVRRWQSKHDILRGPSWQRD